MQAMILAAGFGSRLQPYTNTKPKPLFPLLNIPLLLLNVQRLKSAGFDHIIINCHHLKDQVKAALANIPGVSLQEEERIMGTGGGLRLALDTLRDEPLLVTNGDIYHTVDLRQLYQKHTEGNVSVTLAVHDYPRFNQLSISANRLVGFGKMENEKAAAFTGLHVIDPQILTPLSVAQPSSIIDCYNSLLRQGQIIAVSRVDNDFWIDMGTLHDYLELHGNLLHGKVPRWHQLPKKKASPFLIEDEADCGRNMELQDWASIGRARIGKNVRICRSVIWDGAVIPDNSVIVDSLIV